MLSIAPKSAVSAMQLLIFTVAVFSSHSSIAAVITNLSNTPQTVEVGIGEHARSVDIHPGETWRVPGKIVAQYHGHEVHMNNDEEYAIWQDGTFGPQMREKHGTGNVGM